jgi:hypothetical protein
MIPDLSSPGPLDPSHFIEHVTRTALLLEALARDVKRLADETTRVLGNVDGLRASLNSTATEFAVFKVDTAAKISANKETIDGLTERIKWLNRLIISGLIAGIISGIIALVFKAL